MRKRKSSRGRTQPVSPTSRKQKENENRRVTDLIFQIIRPDEWRHEAPEPEGLKTMLFGFQKRAVSWMGWRENPLSVEPPPEFQPDGVRGGILADEMGLGKTVELISHILSAEGAMNAARNTHADLDEDWASGKVLSTSATLIVVPLPIIDQWIEEIQKHSTLKVFRYEGLKAHGLNVRRVKRKVDERSSVDLLTPPVGDHLPEILAQMMSASVILTDYEVLRREVYFDRRNMTRMLRNAREYSYPDCPLIRLAWHRIVLDEAQMVGIGNVCQMTEKIVAKNRWCVTGTPIGKGGLSDIQGLLKILQHPVYEDLRAFRQCVAVPLAQEAESGVENVKNALKGIMWRTPKTAAEYPLPPRNIEVARLKLSSQEKVFYQHLKEKLKDLMAVDCGTEEQKRAMSSSHLHQLRLGCIHPQLTSFWRQMSTELQLEQGGGALSIDEILSRLRDATQLELQGEERSMCACLNAITKKILAREELRHEDLDEALGVCMQSYWVGEKGIDALAGSNFAELDDISAAQGSIRTWRLVQVHTLSLLVQILKEMGRPDDIPQYERDKAEHWTDLRDGADRALGQAKKQVENLKRSFEENSGKLKVEWERALQCGFPGAAADHPVRWVERLARAYDRAVAKEISEREKRIKLQKDGSILEVLMGSEVSKVLSKLEKELGPAKEVIEHEFNSRATQAALVVVSRSLEEISQAKAYPNYQPRPLYPSYVDFLKHEVPQWTREVFFPLFNISQAVLDDPDIQIRRWPCLRENSAVHDTGGAAEAAKKEVGWLQDLQNSFSRTLSTLSLQRSRNASLQGLSRQSLDAIVSGKTAMKHKTDLVRLLRDRHRAELNVELKIHGQEQINLEFRAACDGQYVGSEQFNCSKAALQLRVDQLRSKCTQLKARRNYIQNQIEAFAEHQHANSSLDNAPSGPSTSANERAEHRPLSNGTNGSSGVHCGCHKNNGCERGQRMNMGGHGEASIPNGHGHASACRQPSGNPQCGEARGQKFMCGICYAEQVQKLTVFDCSHFICSTCAEGLKQHREPKCPFCRCSVSFTKSFQVATKRANHQSKGGEIEDHLHLSKIHVDGEWMSKIEAVVRRLKFLQRNFPGEKCLVFSSFSSALELLGRALTLNGLKHTAMLGSAQVSNRKALNAFHNDPNVNILLLSLKSGAQGLTLTSARHVILLEPSLDPAIQQQAIARVHRIGQTKPVTITRMVTVDTVEETVLDREGKYPTLLPGEIDSDVLMEVLDNPR